MLVVKVGGAQGVNLDAVCDDLAALAREGRRWILVHGGSAETNRIAERLGHPPRFLTSVSGYTSRYTDPATLEIFQMVYCGKINKQIVGRLQARGVNAIGLSGMDGRLLQAKRKELLKVRENDRIVAVRDDLSGRLEAVNADLLRLLDGAGYYPVISPPAIGADGQGLNIDGDRAAARIATALRCEDLVILSDVPGLLRAFPDPQSLIRELAPEEIEDAAARFAAGRMRTKLLGAREALMDGVARVVIGDSRLEHPVRAALAGAGTTMRAGVETAGRGDSPRDAVEIETRLGSGVYPLRGLTLVRGKGALVFDEEGRRYIDAVSGISSANLGHGHPTVLAALREQAEQLMVCAGIFSNDRRAELLERLIEVAPAGIERVFLCNSGTEAVEGAIKFARQATGRAGIVAVRGGFHGRTLGALSATWEEDYRRPFEPLVPGFTHVPLNDPEEVAEAVNERTAAVIVEVVQGEGGVRPATAEFLRAAQDVCRARGAMLIVDEVQTGFGRTGRLFAVQHHDLHPDLICLAKSMAGGLPMGCVLIGERVGAIPAKTHGSTLGGNPLACAAAIAALDVLRDERLPERAAEMGKRAMDRLRSLASPVVREVRGLGLLIGIDLRTRAVGYIRKLQERGILVLQAGPTVIRILPPLVIQEAELDELLDGIDHVLAVQ